MKIEVLYFEGCRNHPPATELARDVVRALGVDATIEEVEVFGPEDAERLRFFGSPSIHVDGIDIDPAVEGRTDYAFGCRTYSGGGVPPRAMLEEAINRATGNPIPTSFRPTRGLASALGSVIAAAGASACCWVPLVAIALGGSAAGSAAFFERWRPWLIGASVVLLGFGFYSVYGRSGRQSACCPDDTCHARRGPLVVLNQTMLWIAAAAVGALIFFPKWGHVLLDDSGSEVVVVDASSVGTVRLEIDGLTCETCATHLERELSGMAGVVTADADYAQGMALVTVHRDAVPSRDALETTVSQAGYTLTDLSVPPNDN